MVQLRPVSLNNGVAIGVEVELPGTHLAILVAGRGYVMCGALDVEGLDRLLPERHVLAGRAVGVRTVADLLTARLEAVTEALAAQGVTPGTPVRQVLELLLAEGDGDARFGPS